MPTPDKVALVLLPAALLTLLGVGCAQALSDTSLVQQLFVHGTYYFLMVTLLAWAGVHLHALRGVRRERLLGWVRENWPGLVIALALTLIAWLAVPPALRMLSDEANLVGTSKNLFASKTATFTVSGKSYYDSYWDIDVAIDRRPPLFPFLVSLLHVVLGYSYRNVFLFNLMVLPAFVLVAYRLAKSLGGESFAVVASLLVVAHPITLIAVRSGGFDFFAAFFALLVIKSFLDYVGAPTPARLAMLWMNLVMFAEIRYESALFLVPTVVILLLFRTITWSMLRPYALIYALSPAYLMPRIWQTILRGSVPEQDPGMVAVGSQNLGKNLREYLAPVLSPFHAHPAHSGIIIALGLLGCSLWLVVHWRWVAKPAWRAPHIRFLVFILVWMSVQALILFAYGWGRAQSPAAARLFIALDTFLSFAAAWLLTRSLGRWPSLVAVMLAAALLVSQVPLAAQHRMLNRLTQTRESATTWRFFASLHEKRIIIVSDRPNLFTIMEYGAMSFAEARQDPVILQAFAHHLFYDIYLVQQISLATDQPRPGYESPWPSRKLETMLEFQNDADVSIRITRLAH
ncbi:MAG: hypothetical protein ABSB49_02730 [Polyangia bacterium]|jgi:hypothetical protein